MEVKLGCRLSTRPMKEKAMPLKVYAVKVKANIKERALHIAQTTKLCTKHRIAPWKKTAKRRRQKVGVALPLDRHKGRREEMGGEGGDSQAISTVAL